MEASRYTTATAYGYRADVSWKKVHTGGTVYECLCHRIHKLYIHIIVNHYYFRNFISKRNRKCVHCPVGGRKRDEKKSEEEKGTKKIRRKKKGTKKIRREKKGTKKIRKKEKGTKKIRRKKKGRKKFGGRKKGRKKVGGRKRDEKKSEEKTKNHPWFFLAWKRTGRGGGKKNPKKNPAACQWRRWKRKKSRSFGVSTLLMSAVLVFFLSFA